MTSEVIDNPFRAGPGLYPPYLAGRKSESLVIDSTIGFIKGKAGKMDRSPFPPLILLGPRGVGKTVLLGRAIEKAESYKIHTAKINCEQLSGPDNEILDFMFPDGLLKSVLDRVDTIGVNVEGSGVKLGLKDPQSNIRSVVPAFLSKKPLLLVLDEAHHCKPENLNKLFEVTQECMTARLPIALIIAGTPGLESLLRRCKATYVERYKDLRINTLSQEDARVALEVPAKEDGRPFDQDALEILLDWSDAYPYFIQLAGEYAWLESTQRGGETISLEDARAGLKKSNDTRDTFYARRRWELAKRELVKYAIHAATILKESRHGRIDELIFANRLMERNKEMERQFALKIVEDLQGDGFIWLNVDMVEAGIPSMFDYLIRKHQEEKTVS